MQRKNIKADAVTVLIWDAAAYNVKVVQASNKFHYAHGKDNDLRNAPLYAARTIDIESLMNNNAIQIQLADSGLHKMCFWDSIKYVLTPDLGLNCVLDDDNLDVKKTYQCEVGLSRSPRVLGALVNLFNEGLQQRSMKEMDLIIELNQIRKQQWVLKNELNEVKFNLFWCQYEVEGLEYYFANRLNKMIIKWVRDHTQTAALVASVVMPMSVAQKWFITLNGKKFKENEEPLRIVQHHGTWTTKNEGFCPISYLVKTFNNNESYAYLMKDESRWYDFKKPDITYCCETDEFTLEAQKICADVQLDSKIQQWYEV